MGDSVTRHIYDYAVVRHLWSLVPVGGSLPDDVWQKRHRFIVGLTWLHAAIIALVGPVLGYSWELNLGALLRDGTVLHTVGEGLAVAFFAVLAGRKGATRTFRATAVSFGLMSSSAFLVHLSGGYIELHFHFFIMLAFLALYQDWVPYLLAIAYVAIHHGVVGVYWPEEVYNHRAAINAPWTWAGIHAFFVLWASVGSIIAWRFNEIASARTRLILDSAGEGIYGLDLNGRTTFVNPAAASMLGYEAEELIGKSMHDVLHHSEPDGTPYPEEDCPIYAVFKDGAARRVTDEVFWRRDGTSFPVEYLSTPIVERRQLRGAVVTFNDITERKRAEEALREANDTLNAVIQASPMGITILDPDGNVKLWNPAAERIFGWQEEEVLGRPLPSIPLDKSEEHRAFRERVLRGEAFSDTEVVRQKKDGSLVDIGLSTAPLRDAKGDICGAMGIMADITERKRAEESLHALYRASLQIQEPLGLRQRLERLLQTAQTLLELDRINILLADPEGRMLQAVASHGVEEPLEAIQVPIGPEGGGIAQAYLTRRMIVWDGLAPVPEQLRLQPPYDRIAAFRSQVFANVPLVVQGRAIGVLGADRKHSRRPLDGATLELLQLFSSQAAVAIEQGRFYEAQRMGSIQLETTVEARTQELQTVNLRLEEASRHKSEFLAAMSHELRTPLNSILGFSELLQDPTHGSLNEKQARYVQNIRLGGQHLLALINDLLDLSKVEAGKLELQPETFSLPDAIKAAFRIIWPQAEAKHQVLELQVADDLPTIRADLVRFTQILCNLLSNAVKFTPDAGRITVTAQRGSRGEGPGARDGSPLDPTPHTLQSDGFVELAVQDTGIGIRPEDLAKLFQSFTQIEHTFATRYQGTGLGLALTKQLVELHGGTIWAESLGEGKGSRFTVLLPRAGPREIPRLLLVEDDEALVATLRDGLQAAGYQVEMARDGATALAQVATARPDLVILDLGLPTVDGWEVLRQLRADASTRSLPVLTITGVDVELAEEALTAGANEFLTKPFSLTVLESTIGRLLQGGATRRPIGREASRRPCDPLVEA